MALGATSAFALSPAQLTSGTAPKLLYAAGGSAQAPAFVVAATRLLDNIDIYTDDATNADAGSYRIVTGTLKASLADWTAGSQSIAAGTKVVLFYKFNGGSFLNGINPFRVDSSGNPVSPAITLPYPTLATIAASSAVTPIGPGHATYHTNTAGAFGVLGNQQQVSPAWGVADVEVALFRDYNNPSVEIANNIGNGATNANSLGGAAPNVGQSYSIYNNLFGVALTTNLYAAKKDFTKAEVAGILSGRDNGLESAEW